MLTKEEVISLLGGYELVPHEALKPIIEGLPKLDHRPREIREIVICIHQLFFYPQLKVMNIRDICQASDNNISTRFDRAMGMGIKQYLDETRMKAASILLLDPKLKIDGVAIGVGYFHIETFYQVFRRYFSCTPGAYRAERTSV